jgi:hypothetical protein
MNLISYQDQVVNQKEHFDQQASEKKIVSTTMQ